MFFADANQRLAPASWPCRSSISGRDHGYAACQPPGCCHAPTAAEAARCRPVESATACGRMCRMSKDPRHTRWVSTSVFPLFPISPKRTRMDENQLSGSSCGLPLPPARSPCSAVSMATTTCLSCSFPISLRGSGIKKKIKETLRALAIMGSSAQLGIVRPFSQLSVVPRDLRTLAANSVGVKPRASRAVRIFWGCHDIIWITLISPRSIPQRLDCVNRF